MAGLRVLLSLIINSLSPQFDGFPLIGLSPHSRHYRICAAVHFPEDHVTPYPK
jgi:hypothetical protein